MIVSKNGAKKIAIFLPSLAGGGAERTMLNLAQGFAESGCRVDLVLAQAKGAYIGEVPPLVRVVNLQAARVLASLPPLMRYLRRERPMALLSALDYANVVALWASSLAGVPLKVAVNEQNTISYSATHSARRRQRLVPHLVKRFYPWADYVIGNSRGVANDLIRLTGLPPHRVLVLYNPVITPLLREKARAPVNHPWLANGEPVIVGAGRFTQQKDFPTLIRAFAKVRQTRPARLILLGEGPDRAELELLVRQLSLDADVAMPGFVENPYGYMARSAAFVLSSRWEGLPTVLIEAMYAGAPIIATDCPSGPREILQDGRYGQLVPVGDPVALARAIELTLSWKKEAPPAESWQPFELETVRDQYLRLLLPH